MVFYLDFAFKFPKYQVVSTFRRMMIRNEKFQKETCKLQNETK